MNKSEGAERIGALATEMVKLMRAHVDSLDGLDAVTVASFASGIALGVALIDDILRPGEPDADALLDLIHSAPWEEVAPWAIELESEYPKGGRT